MTSGDGVRGERACRYCIVLPGSHRTDSSDALSVKVSPEEVGVVATAVALAVFSPSSTITTSGEHEVVRDMDTVAPRLAPLTRSHPASVCPCYLAEVSGFGHGTVHGYGRVGLDEPVKHPVPLQDQSWNVKPDWEVAVATTDDPASIHSLEEPSCQLLQERRRP